MKTQHNPFPQNTSLIRAQHFQLIPTKAGTPLAVHWFLSRTCC